MLHVINCSVWLRVKSKGHDLRCLSRSAGGKARLWLQWAWGPIPIVRRAISLSKSNSRRIGCCRWEFSRFHSSPFQRCRKSTTLAFKKKTLPMLAICLDTIAKEETRTTYFWEEEIRKNRCSKSRRKIITSLSLHPHNPKIDPLSSSSSALACCLNASAWNLRNALWILSLPSRSLPICCLALNVPVSSPVSPPKKIPPLPSSRYVATLPSVLGFITLVRSGKGSSFPDAKRSAVGCSAVRKALKTAVRLLRSRKARKVPSARPRKLPTLACVETVRAALCRASRSDCWRLFGFVLVEGG